MLTSEQAAAMIAAQQQRAGMMNGPMPVGPSMAPMQGPSHYPPMMAPSFNYGMQNVHSGAVGASSAAAGTVGAAPTMYAGAVGAAGVASMMGAGGPVVGALTSRFMDPLGHGVMMGGRAGMAAYGGGAGMGSSLGAGAMVAAPWMAAGAIGLGGMAVGASQFVQGAAQNRTTMGLLGNMSFANAGAPQGRGFGYEQMRSITEVMREIDKADPFTEMADMNRMLSNFTDLGMAQGVQDAKEFGKKFKQMTETVRDMARSMGTSMEDAAGAFANMRQAGFFTGADIMGNTRDLMVAKGMGMSEQEFYGAQQGGAQFSRGQSMSGRTGAGIVTGMAARFMSDIKSGRLQDTTLMDITGGGSAAEASLMLGQDLLQAQTGFLQGGAGRSLMAAFGTRDSGGRFQGGIDSARLQEFVQGGGSLDDLTRLGREGLSSREGQASFKFRERDIGDAFLQEGDALKSITEIIRNSTTVKGDKDMAGILMQKMLGIDHLRAQQIQDLVDTWDQNNENMTRDAVQELSAAAMQLEQRQNYTVSGITQQVGGGVRDTLQPLRSAADSAITSVDLIGQEIGDSIIGRDRTGIGDVEVQMGARQAMRGRGRALAGAGAARGFFEKEEMGITGRARPEMFLRDMGRSQQEADSARARMQADPAYDAAMKKAMRDPSASNMRALQTIAERSLGIDTVEMDWKTRSRSGVAHRVRRRSRTAAEDAEIGYLFASSGGAGPALAAEMFAGDPSNPLYRATSSRDSFGSYTSSKYGVSLSESAMTLMGTLDIDNASYDRRLEEMVGKGHRLGDPAKAALLEELSKEAGFSVSQADLDQVLELSGAAGDAFGTLRLGAESFVGEDARTDMAQATGIGFGMSKLSGVMPGKLTALREGITRGGPAAHRAFGDLLAGTEDLSGLAGDPLADLLMQSRRGFGKLQGEGFTNEAALSAALGLSESQLRDQLGGALTAKQTEGLTKEEARELFTTASGEAFLGVAAAGGTGMSFRGSATKSIENLALSTGLLLEETRALREEGKGADSLGTLVGNAIDLARE